VSRHHDPLKTTGYHCHSLLSVWTELFLHIWAIHSNLHLRTINEIWFIRWLCFPAGSMDLFWAVSRSGLLVRDCLWNVMGFTCYKFYFLFFTCSHSQRKTVETLQTSKKWWFQMPKNQYKNLTFILSLYENSQERYIQAFQQYNQHFLTNWSYNSIQNQST